MTRRSSVRNASDTTVASKLRASCMLRLVRKSMDRRIDGGGRLENVEWFKSHVKCAQGDRWEQCCMLAACA